MNRQHWAILVCLFLALFTNCAVEAKPVSGNTTNTEDGCLLKGVSYKKNERWAGPLGECTIYTCKGENQFSILTCPYFPLYQNTLCFQDKMNYKVQYPWCCPRVACPLVGPIMKE